MKTTGGVGQSVGASVLLLVALFAMPLGTVTPFRQADAEQLPPKQEQTAPQGSAVGREESAVVLRILNGETVEAWELEDYLTGVVRAEMPASFSAEALKAQTVAARTYTLYKTAEGGKHGGLADLCTDPACCQAWLSREEARQNWGEQAEAYEAKIDAAVRETDGEVILYGGEPILAVFHSSSAGRTRGAGEVWRSDLPYLQPVESPEGAEGVPDYYSRVELSAGAFQEKVLSAHPEADLSGPPSGWLRDAVTDSAGSVNTVLVGGVPVKGTELRALLGLRSACFTWDAGEDRLVFFVTGYGHGVGLSQYGAEAMAATGANYREILKHYYVGTEVGQYSGGLRR